MGNPLYKLPVGVNLPAKYKKTINSRRLFIEGAQDGLAGRALTPEFKRELLKHQGDTAWQAYNEGHAAGTKARAK